MNDSHVLPAGFSDSDSGRPVSTSNGSPRLAACISSDRYWSANALVTNVLDRGLPARLHLTVYVRRFSRLFTRISQIRTSWTFMLPRSGDGRARTADHCATLGARRWEAGCSLGRCPV